MDNSLPTSNQKLRLTSFKSKFKAPKLPFQFDFFLSPGVYAVVNTTDNRYYIGESVNVASRLADHKTILEAKTKSHECIPMQKDWDKHGSSSFEFYILEVGPQWTDRSKRLSAERRYIQLVGSENVYNSISLAPILKKEGDGTRRPYANSKPVVIEAVIYISISEAARSLGVTPGVIKNHICDSNEKDWHFFESDTDRSTKIGRAVVDSDKKLFVSLEATAQFHTRSVKTIRKYIREKNNWFFFDQLLAEQQEKIRRLNPDAPEIFSVNTGRPVKVGKTIYPSIKKAALAYQIDPKSVQKRIKSKKKQFEHWEWAE